MDLNLNGKNVLITGGSAGIGLACALAFATEGCKLHLAARDAKNLSAARERIVAAHPGVSVTCHTVDLSDSAQLRQLATACGKIDILVNNAGAIPGGTIDVVDEAAWRAAWDLKVFGYINLLREVYRDMREAGSGVIVNVIGMAGERPKANYIAGSGGNAALMAISRAIGADGPDHGVRVLAVNPGLVATERLEKIMRERAVATLKDESRWKEIYDDSVKSLPFRRAARPDEVANVVVFMASDRASYVSGTVVTVDAGFNVMI